MKNVFRTEAEVKSAYDFTGSFTDIGQKVYKLSIGSVCLLTWPSDRVIFQILDDSTNRLLRTLVEMESKKWTERGVNVKHQTRTNRNGYKAGALREGTVALWHLKAIKDAGGWKQITTVEDMDLAVRTNLKGWEFSFVGDFEVENELPGTFKSNRNQKHRWSCGPANLISKITKEVIACERVSFWKKFDVTYAFFIVRKIIAHWITFLYYSVIIPISIMVPEVTLPATTTILNSSCTLRSLHLLVLRILFQNVLSFQRCKTTIIGLLGANRVKEWVVIKTLKNATKPRRSIRPPRSSSFGERFLFSELVIGLFLLYLACYDIIFGNTHMFIYLLLQAAAFFVVGVGYVAISTPN